MSFEVLHLIALFLQKFQLDILGANNVFIIKYLRFFKHFF